MYQYDINGSLIAEYPTARDAAMATGFAYGNIAFACSSALDTSVAQKKRYITHGFLFTYDANLSKDEVWNRYVESRNESIKI